MISFIIPAHNEEALLERTLRALTATAGAVGEPCEIIVADDASTDRTAEIAASCGAELVSIDRRQIAAARNAGASIATGQYLIFVDADTIVGEAPLRGAVEALKAGAVGGGAMIRFDGRIPRWARLTFGFWMWLYFDLLRLSSGSFLFCTRRAFEAVGGFDEAIFAAEETYMSRALKKQGRFVIVREPVITSGRKLRQYSARELFGCLLSIGLRGRKGLENRNLKAYDIWYGPRRREE
jgi:glycosyltransferase involved in cell wall biosynthesis